MTSLHNSPAFGFGKLPSIHKLKLRPQQAYLTSFASATLLAGYGLWKVAHASQLLPMEPLDTNHPATKAVSSIAEAMGVTADTIDVRITPESSCSAHGSLIPLGTYTKRVLRNTTALTEFISRLTSIFSFDVLHSVHEERKQKTAVVVISQDLVEHLVDSQTRKPEFVYKIGNIEIDPILLEPSKREIEFRIAHEIGHIKQNHPLQAALAVPLLLVGTIGFAPVLRPLSRVLRTHYNLFMDTTLRYLLPFLMGYTAFSRKQEMEADHEAALAGFADGGEKTFRRHLELNRQVREYANAKWTISPSGNYLLDWDHPMLSTRLKQMHKFSKYS